MSMIVRSSLGVSDAGVSYVGVQPTHRRLGLLRAMMRRQLDDVRDRGEALAVLTASEGGIYGRFGYGPATFVAAYEIDRPTGLARKPEGTIRLVSGDVAAGAFPAVYDDARRRQPGEVGRAQPWWDSFFHDYEGRRSGAGPLFHALRAGPAPFDVECRRHDEFMLRHRQELPLERGLDVLKPAGIWSAGRTQMRPGASNRHAEALGDAFGEFGGNVGLARRRIVAVPEHRDGGQR